MLREVVAFLGGIAWMRFDEQVLLDNERRERNELSALLHLLLRLVEREQEHVFEHLRNLGDFLR